MSTRHTALKAGDRVRVVKYVKQTYSDRHHLGDLSGATGVVVAPLLSDLVFDRVRVALDAKSGWHGTGFAFSRDELELVTDEDVPNNPEGKAAPAGDASDSGGVAHSNTNAGVTPAPLVHPEKDPDEYIATLDNGRAWPQSENE